MAKKLTALLILGLVTTQPVNVAAARM